MTQLVICKKINLVRNGQFVGQLNCMPACTAGAVPRMAMPNPPAITAPTIAKILRNISSLKTKILVNKLDDYNVPHCPTLSHCVPQI